MIRPATEDDAAAIVAIYNGYVLDSTATFEEDPVSEDEMRGRIRDVLAAYPWLVAEAEGRMLGYAYGRRWQVRSAYRYTCEVGIYLAPDATRQGLGTALYTRLLGLLREAGLHAVVAGITLPNPGSVALHERMGFRPAAHYREVGRKFDRWLDVGYWHLLLGEPAGPDGATAS